jgi:hypothetical protein
MIPAHIRVIGRRAFQDTNCCTIRFENLREIQEEAFSGCKILTKFNVPSSVETIGDRSFDGCKNMAVMSFEEPSKLKTIGKRAFAGCPLTAITIPASLEKIDGSAFVGCPLLVIRVAVENRNFKVEGALLTTADGREIVRYFGREREVIVPKTVEVLRKSCFESINSFERVVFENGSKLRQIGSSAFSNCEFLTSIMVPGSVEIIGESAFRKCDGLEQCLMDRDAALVRIEEKAFTDCRSLRSFDVPKSVARIGRKCFKRCRCLHQLTFGCTATLKRIIGDVILDEALDQIGFADISGLFRIEVNDEGVDLEFPGWISVGEGDSTLVLIQANE